MGGPCWELPLIAVQVIPPTLSMRSSFLDSASTMFATLTTPASIVAAIDAISSILNSAAFSPELFTASSSSSSLSSAAGSTRLSASDLAKVVAVGSRFRDDAGKRIREPVPVVWNILQNGFPYMQLNFQLWETKTVLTLSPGDFISFINTYPKLILKFRNLYVSSSGLFQHPSWST